MDPEDVRLVLAGFEVVANTFADEYCNHFERPEEDIEWALSPDSFEERKTYYEAYLRLKAALGDKA